MIGEIIMIILYLLFMIAVGMAIGWVIAKLFGLL